MFQLQILIFKTNRAQDNRTFFGGQICINNNVGHFDYSFILATEYIKIKVIYFICQVELNTIDYIS